MGACGNLVKLATLLTTVHFIVLINLSKRFPPSAPTPANLIPNCPSFDRELYEKLSSNRKTGSNPSVLLAAFIGVAVGILSLIAQALSASAIAHAVRSIYNRKSVTFTDVLNAAMSRLWTRLTVATLCYGGLYSVGILVILEIVGHFALLLGFPANSLLLVILTMSVMVMLVIPVQITLHMIFLVRSGVSVLKEHGWAALKRDMELRFQRACPAVIKYLVEASFKFPKMVELCKDVFRGMPLQACNNIVNYNDLVTDSQNIFLSALDFAADGTWKAMDKVDEEIFHQYPVCKVMGNCITAATRGVFSFL